ncbi:peptidylprolyl isomerase [Oscillatoria sp. FACHB-1406]|uniref:peptidylprolyl isomerase n=1 Tax=Oscillatoria sp. FACHB-1406 TaxID=2692846 RepID=UPI001687DFAA|nr:peptidylprolyl isomerase [Oscillatoria sp. FACHB-1406]MBD2578049.1 peptidylprolyl isomerase [Oscillatoria sp. FACHB-1406]
MRAVLQVGDRAISAAEIVPLLDKYQLLPQLLREIIIDRALEDIALSPEERQQAYQTFCAQQQIMGETERQAWLERRGIKQEQLEALVERGFKTEKFKQQTWDNQLESYFLQRKAKLDKVVYSLLRTTDAGIAQELYCRLLEEEATFEELARDYSQGPEAKSGGKIGPVELSHPHPTLAKMLSISTPGQLWPPTHLSEWFVIVRLDEFRPAQLDDAMRQQLLNERFNSWLQEEVQKASILPDPVEADPWKDTELTPIES